MVLKKRSANTQRSVSLQDMLLPDGCVFSCRVNGSKMQVKGMIVKMKETSEKGNVYFHTGVTFNY